MLSSAVEEVAARWSFPALLEHWNRKHAKAAYVPSLFQTPPPEYAYGPKILLCERTDFMLFLKAFASGMVYYDPALKLEAASNPKSSAKPRSQFRVRHRDITSMYHSHEVVDLTGSELRLKIAATLDGRTALPDGRSQWITDTAARTDGHRWRARAGAVLTGIGTVLDDDPRLDVRLVDTVLQPGRIVVDTHFRTPPNARLLAAPGQARVIGAQAHPERMAALRHAGAMVQTLPSAAGQVDLPALLTQLAAEGINELHVEAGARLNAALLAAGLVDELLVYLAPKLLGPGRGMADWPTLQALEDAACWRFEAVDRVGQDLCLRLERPGARDFLSGASATADGIITHPGSSQRAPQPLPGHG